MHSQLNNILQSVKTLTGENHLQQNYENKGGIIILIHRLIKWQIMKTVNTITKDKILTLAPTHWVLTQFKLWHDHGMIIMIPESN